jgi:hypothetical protein
MKHDNYKAQESCGSDEETGKCETRVLAAVFWKATSNTAVAVRRHFGRICCLHFQGRMERMEAERISET